jgi:hypothetical protein
VRKGERHGPHAKPECHESKRLIRSSAGIPPEDVEANRDIQDRYAS